MSPDGPEFSKFVQGYWRMAEWDMTPQQRLSFINHHVDMGITTVDHAHIYGNPPCETLFGEALRLDPALREKIEIISKCGITPGHNNHVSHYNNSKTSILSSVDTSLSRLGLEYLDVLLIHRADYLLEADDVADAFDHLKRSGKVKYFGVSNFTASQFSLLQSRLDVSLVTNQIEINPLNFKGAEEGTLDLLQQLHIRPMAWSCLAGGQIFKAQSEQADRLRKTLTDLREELGATSIDQVIYAWILKMPSRPIAILGSGKLHRVASAVASLDLCMTPEQWYRVWVASKGHKVP